ncbi:LPS 1,2-glucosyltransferase [Spirochaetia bacterium]|nr:LPS 1,2-glucosyltransferase [Spirochaetia bacterium]
MEIAFCTDNNYIMPYGVLIKSILHTNSDSVIKFHLISEYISEDNKNKLKSLMNEKSEIDFYSINPNLYKNLIIRNERFTLAIYIRFFLSYILPESIDKVLYLDGDMICLDSLNSLWQTDINNYPAAAAIDSSQDDIRNYNRLGYDPTLGYYNPGTLLINLNYWRTYKIPEKLVEFVSKNPEKCKWYDQDALNHIFANNWKHLSARYNCQIIYYTTKIEDLSIRKNLHDDINNSRLNPVILHYSGEFKPWHKEEHNMPFTKLWLFFFNLSPWKNEKLKYRGKYNKIQLVKKNVVKPILIKLHLYHLKQWKSFDNTLDVNKLFDSIIEKLL